MGQVGAGGVRQDLLDDGGHHGLVVAVPAARAIGGGDPKSGKKRVSGQSPASPLPPFPHPPVPFSSPWEAGGLSCPMGLGAGTAHAQPSPPSLGSVTLGCLLSAML